MAKPDTNMDYDAISAIRQNRKNRRENEKKHKHDRDKKKRGFDDDNYEFEDGKGNKWK